MAPQNNVVTIGLRIMEAGPTSPLHPGAGTVSRTELMSSCTGSIYQLLSQTNVTPRQCIDALAARVARCSMSINAGDRPPVPPG